MVVDGELDASLVAGIDHAVGLGEVERHGLLAEHVRAVLCRRYRSGAVLRPLRGNSDDVRLLRRKHGVVVGVALLDVERVANRVQLLFHNVAHGHSVNFRDLVLGPQVRRAHAAAADEHRSIAFHRSFLLLTVEKSGVGPSFRRKPESRGGRQCAVPGAILLYATTPIPHQTRRSPHMSGLKLRAITFGDSHLTCCVRPVSAAR